MKTLTLSALMLCLAVCTRMALAGQSGADAQRLWNKDLPDIRAVGLSESGKCVAVATLDRISLFSRSGGELWHWDFKKGNRFMAALQIAVSPSCDWLAFAGSPDYRYAWLAHRNGSLAPIQTVATPVGIAISHDGNLLALGTGAGEVWLLDSSGTIKWKRNVQYCCAQELSFSDGDSAVVVSGIGSGIVSIDGTVRWTGPWYGTKAARDLNAFVAWSEPPHGPGFGRVALLDANGSVQWEKYALFGAASIISPSGDLIIGPISVNQNPGPDEGFSGSPFHSAPHFLRLLSKSGDTLRTFEVEASPFAFNVKGDRFLLRTDRGFEVRDLIGNRLWGVGSFAPYYVERMQTTPDLTDVVVSWENGLSWFSATADAQ